MAGSFWGYFWQYFPVAFFSALGVLQIAVARADLKGLAFFRKPFLCYLFGAVAIIGAFVWFYATGDRNAEPLMRIDNGVKIFFGEAESFGTFMTGAIGALVATIVLSSLLNAKMSRNPNPYHKEVPRGLDALKEMTFFQAIMRSLGKGS